MNHTNRSLPGIQGILQLEIVQVKQKLKSVLQTNEVSLLSVATVANVKTKDRKAKRMRNEFYEENLMFNNTAILVLINGVGETVAEVMSLVWYVSTSSATHSSCRITDE